MTLKNVDKFALSLSEVEERAYARDFTVQCTVTSPSTTRWLRLAGVCVSLRKVSSFVETLAH